MSDCCSTPAPPAIEKNEPAIAADRIHCPECGKKGKKVDTQIVKAMLSVSLESLYAEAYRFCKTERCPVVYFAVDTAEIYHEEDIRVRVHQKAPRAADVPVCYCFKHTPDTIRQELLATGTSTTAQTITEAIDAGQCACDLRNPQGSCCLGNVNALVKNIAAELTPEIA